MNLSRNVIYLFYLIFFSLATISCGDDSKKDGKENGDGDNDTVIVDDNTQTEEPDDDKLDPSEEKDEDQVNPEKDDDPVDPEPSDEDKITTDDDTGEVPDSEPEEKLLISRKGDRLYATVNGLKVIDGELWVSTMHQFEPITEKPKGGIMRINLETGAVINHEKDMPTLTYGNPPMTPEYEAVVDTATVIKDGDRFLILALAGLVVYENGKFAYHQFKIDEKHIFGPSGIAFDKERKTIWFSGMGGLLAVDSETYKVKKWIKDDVLGTLSTGRIALDPKTGAIYTAYVKEQEDPGPGPGPDGPDLPLNNRIRKTRRSGFPIQKVLKIENYAVTASVEVAENGLPMGYLGDIVWSKKKNALIIALQSLEPQLGAVVAWDGTNIETIATDGELSPIPENKGSLGAGKLVIDPTGTLLLVGGQFSSGMHGITGGGMAWINLETGKIRKLPMDFPLFFQPNSMAYDPVTKRTFVAAYTPCNDRQLGNRGLYAFSFREDNSVRIERPLVSTVTSMFKDGEKVYATLKDDNSGSACMGGVAVQSDLLELKKNGFGEVVKLYSETNKRVYERVAAVTSDIRNGKVLMGLFPGELYFGDFDDINVVNPTFGQIGTSKYFRDVKWRDDNSFWIAGSAQHSRGYNGEEPDPNMANVGPRGAALVTLDDEGNIKEAFHYVLATRDEPEANEKVGIPSSDVYQAVVAEDGSTYLICGTERNMPLGDLRLETDAYVLEGKKRLGGVALVKKDGSFENIISGEILPDPRIAALKDDGSLVVIDKEKGPYIYKDKKTEAYDIGFEWKNTMTPNDLWIEKEDFAFMFNEGAIVKLDGIQKEIKEVGFTWDALKRAEGVLYIGTDRGIVKVMTEDAADVTESPIGEAVDPFNIKDR